MRVHCVMLCQGPDVIAVLKANGEDEGYWFVNNVLVEDIEEFTQLEAEISGDGTGYMRFRGVEYEDVQVVVRRW